MTVWNIGRIVSLCKHTTMLKHTILMMGVCALVASCNLEGQKPTDEEVANLQKNHDDSVAIVLDSLKKVNIYVPPLYDKNAFDTNAARDFFELAKNSGGELKVLVNSKLLATEITRIVKDNSADNADLLFLMDKTSSMADDIDVVKAGLKKILDAVDQHKNVHLGIALYGDKNVDGEDWFSFKDFGTDHHGIRDYIDNIEVTGGGDWPESVYDAFFKVDEQNFWRSATKKMVLLVGDAGSLDKPLADHTLQDVIAKAESDRIKTNFYPIIVTPSYGEEEQPMHVSFHETRIMSSLFPNPSNGNITVNFTLDDTYHIAIFDQAGREVFSDDFTGKEWKKDLSSLNTGAFVLRAVGRNTNFESMKFIIQR